MSAVATRPAKRARRGRRVRGVWPALRGSASGRLGLALALLILVVVTVGPALAPYSPAESGVGPPASGSSSEHLLGTDGLGRDVLSRFLNGGATVLLVPLAATAIGFLAGASLGLLGAYSGGAVDRVVVRAYDLLLTFPPLLLVLVLIAGLGTSTIVVISTVAVVVLPRSGRIVRGAAYAIVPSDYVAAARARGEGTPSIIVREILPNVVGPAIAEFSLRLTYSVIFVSTLAFLGLGPQPPSSDWGLMVSEARGIVSVAPLAMVVPALGIGALSLSCNLIGDALARNFHRDRSQAVNL